jgi:8-oxo-dGTP diphosphatase
MTSVPTANTWVDCDCGHRHWGRYGAAGLLLVWRPPASGHTSGQASGHPSGQASGQTSGHSDVPHVLLQHRAAWTHQGGTWALPGGARSFDETPAQAALREAGEEAGVRPQDVRVTGETVVIDHGPWAYTYVLAEAGSLLAVEPSDEETEDLAWVPVDEVAAYPLHPLFAQAWPALRDRIAGRTGSDL